MSARHLGLSALVLASALFLTSCGSSGDPVAMSSTNSSSAVQTSSAEKQPSTAPSTSAASSIEASEVVKSSVAVSQEPELTPPVPGAYPGAGGPIPQHATKIKTVHSAGYDLKTAIIKTPSGNIGCEIGEGYSGCGVDSWNEDNLYPDPMWGSLWWVDFDRGEGPMKPIVSHRGDAPLYMWGDPNPQVVNYGDVVYYGDFVCASEQTGLTCWNHKTGHGALLNKAGLKAF